MSELNELLQDALDGDADARAVVVERFQKMAFGCAHAILGDFHLAEDACQEAFVEAFRQLPKLRDCDRFAGWFRTIVRTQCRRLTRGWRPRTVPLSHAGPLASKQPEPAEDAETHEIRTKVRTALHQLPEPSRTTATLFYMDGFGHAKIADLLDAPVGTVKRRLHDSRERLREAIAPAAVEAWLDLPGPAVEKPLHAPPPEAPQVTVIPPPIPRSEGEVIMQGERLNEAMITFWDAMENVLTAGLPLMRGLKTLSGEADAPEIKALCQCLAEQIGRGATLSEAMRALDVFLPTEVELVAVGEETGTLDTMCRQAAGKLRKGACLGDRPTITATGLKKANREAGLPDTARKAEAIIKRACQERATDIHLEQAHDETVVRYRIDGVLHEVETMPKRDGRSLCLALKEMGGMDLAEKRLPQRGRAKFSVGSKEHDLRIASTPTAHGENVTIRVLASATVAVKVKDLCGPEDAELLTPLTSLRHGIVFVTGPTGSGKTTVLYALLNDIKANNPGSKICSVEDPIEYILDGVSQMQADPSIGLTVPVALKHMLWSDPDVILVGHLAGADTDRETADWMAQGALTGHLLLTTFHANDAFGALKQVMELIPRREVLADSVAAITSQRLIRTLCPKCKTKYAASEDELQAMGIDSPSPEIALWRPKGCKHCRDTGYRGRSGIFEVLTIKDDVARAIATSAELPLIRQVALDAGLRSMRQNGFAAARRGTTSLAEVLRVTGKSDSLAW